MLRAHAIYENDYLLGTSIARPIIAKHQVEVARANQRRCGRPRRHFQGQRSGSLRADLYVLGPDLKIIAPWKDTTFGLRDRESAIDYANKKGVPVDQSKKKIYSRDRNLWHISHEGADLESPANEPKDDLWMMSVPVSKSPNEPRICDHRLRGRQSRSPSTERKCRGHELIAALNVLGGKHAVGQTQLAENRLVGMKSRGATRPPAARSSTKPTNRSNKSASSATRSITSSKSPWLRRAGLLRPMVSSASRGFADVLSTTRKAR